MGIHFLKSGYSFLGDWGTQSRGVEKDNKKRLFSKKRGITPYRNAPCFFGGWRANKPKIKEFVRRNPKKREGVLKIKERGVAPQWSRRGQLRQKRQPHIRTKDDAMRLSEPLEERFEAPPQHRGGYWHLQVPFQAARHELSNALSPPLGLVLLK
nr:MAG TPA: hypothetical protein [Caudoviricetes sp.]